MANPVNLGIRLKTKAVRATNFSGSAASRSGGATFGYIVSPYGAVFTSLSAQYSCQIVR